ncbi:hypothetical protein POM88_042547 [Heracleum sosnowskyi]|uniref:Uncharacterized protein n=1 Tax=Heracleum sosnowskyi TaxID=360622 RepID=A0AAD8HI33_9APIA|nr:hypothetical protein POM88_042547 [Heracleum sosnowskyi]
MDEKLFSDLEDQIIKSFSKKDHAVYNEHLERHKLNGDPSDDIFLSLPIVSTLIYGEAEFWILTSRHTPRIEINAPIIDGMFPLHLAVMTSSSFLIHKLIGLYGAKLDVKCCGDPGSPFYGLTPLEMALKVLSRNFIPWTPQMSVPELLSMFHANNAKMKSLMFNITILACITPRIRHLVMEYSLQGKVAELAALLNMASSYPIDFSRMNITTPDIPLELHSGVPMNLRLLVATRSASLIKEGIQLSASLNPEEYDNCRIKLKEMDAVRTLLESAEKGDIYRFDVEQKEQRLEMTYWLAKQYLQEAYVQAYGHPTGSNCDSDGIPAFMQEGSVLVGLEDDCFSPEVGVGNPLGEGLNAGRTDFGGTKVQFGALGDIPVVVTDAEDSLSEAETIFSDEERAMERNTVNPVARAVFAINREERTGLIVLRKKIAGLRVFMDTKGLSVADFEKETLTDKSEVNTVAPQYLKNSFSYVDPSKFQPPGIFNSLMPLGYMDSLNYYDGLDIRSCNALAETIFRVLDGRKVEELNLKDTRTFRRNLENCLENKFKEAETLTVIGLVRSFFLQALEEKGPKPGAFFPLSKLFKHMKISTSVLSAVKKVKA